MNASEAFRLIEADWKIIGRALLNQRPDAIELSTAYSRYIAKGTPENEHRFTIAAAAWVKWKTENPDAEELQG